MRDRFESFMTGSGFRLLYAVFTLSFLAGIYLDARAHVQGEVSSFFSESHAVFYVSVAMLGILLVSHLYVTHDFYFSKSKLLHGDWLALIGFVIFTAAGLGDLLWHNAFGFEADTEALLSPTHLGLSIGAFLFTSWPLRQVWRDDAPDRTDTLGGIVAAATVYSLLTFMTMYAHPLIQGLGAPRLGVSSILIQSIILAGFMVALVRFVEVPLGGFTAIMAINAVMVTMPSQTYPYAVALILAGLVADILHESYDLRDNLRMRRVFAATVPATMWLGYFAVRATTSSIGWTIHLWAGAVVLAAIAGLLVSELDTEP